MKQRNASGVLPQEIGVFIRSENDLSRVQTAVKAAGGHDNGIGLCQHHHRALAKDMEFRMLAVMACDDEIISSQVRIDTANKEVELIENYDTARQLLYVARTRAHDQRPVSAMKLESEFL